MLSFGQYKALYKTMHFLATAMLLQCCRVVFTQSCNNLRNIPVDINEDYDDTRYFKGCLTNASFPNEAVQSLNIDCFDAHSIEELPQDFLSFFEDLKEVVVKCSVKTIKPKAFFNLRSVIDVDLSGNQLKSVPSGVFDPIPSLRYLNMSNNAIVFIEDYAFSNLPHLADLDLSHNGLDYISRSWFENTTAIEEFHLSNNFLKEIPENMFTGWSKTYAINFDYNQISRIHNGAFIDNLNYLSLHYNELASINLHAFPNKASIKQLDISCNLLSNLPQEFFKKIKVKHIWIFGNPFECTCLKNLEAALEIRMTEIMKVPPKLSASNEKCFKDFNVPVCVVSTALPLHCNGTEDKELTSRMTNHMRQLGFADLRDWYKQCAVLPRKTYLES